MLHHHLRCTWLVCFLNFHFLSVTDLFFILLVLSTGRLSSSFLAAYSVSKYGVQAFSDALRREMHPWGIKVSIMEPGGFRTGMTEPRAREKQIRQGWDDLSDELKQEYGKEYLEKGVRLSHVLMVFFN